MLLRNTKINLLNKVFQLSLLLYEISRYIVMKEPLLKLKAPILHINLNEIVI